MSKKGCFKKGCMTIVFTVLAVIILLLMLRGCLSRGTLNKRQIIQFVFDNEELLIQAVEEIWGLDDYVSFIANTRFRPRDGLDFEGLFTGGVLDREYITMPLDNPILYELLEDGRIRSIAITRNGFMHGRTYHIRFGFNVRSVWDRHGGIYFSKYDEPMSFDARRWENPEEYRDGWVSYGQAFYYTERIIPHWFYYEMLFNTTRRPSR